jgi:hypothetical protein
MTTNSSICSPKNTRQYREDVVLTKGKKQKETEKIRPFWGVFPLYSVQCRYYTIATK